MALGLVWAVRPVKDAPAALRLLDGSGDLVLDALETEAARPDAAELRVRALEDELRRRG